MSHRAKLVWIWVLALVAVALFGAGLFVWLLTFVCENIGEDAAQTVRCDGERGRSWRIVQAVLVAASGGALLGAITWAAAKELVWPLVAAIVLSGAAFVAVYAISAIRFEDKPAPRLSAVRVLDRRCTEPCAAGIRVAFTLDRRARVRIGLGPDNNSSVEFRPYREGGYRYRSGIVSGPGDQPDEDTEFDAGEHLVRVGGEVVVDVYEPSERIEPLPPGVHVLSVLASVPKSGNQRNANSKEFNHGVRILPRRR